MRSNCKVFSDTVRWYWPLYKPNDAPPPPHPPTHPQNIVVSMRSVTLVILRYFLIFIYISFLRHLRGVQGHSNEGSSTFQPLLRHWTLVLKVSSEIPKCLTSTCRAYREGADTDQVWRGARTNHDLPATKRSLQSLIYFSFLEWIA